LQDKNNVVTAALELATSLTSSSDALLHPDTIPLANMKVNYHLALRWQNMSVV